MALDGSFFFLFTFSLHPCLQCDRIWFLPAHSSVCSCIREISAAVTKWNWALMWWCELGWLCVCVLCQLYNRLTDLLHANWAKLIHFETACVSSVAPFCSFSYSITHFYISFNRIVVFFAFSVSADGSKDCFNYCFKHLGLFSILFLSLKINPSLVPFCFYRLLYDSCDALS